MELIQLKVVLPLHIFESDLFIEGLFTFRLPMRLLFFCLPQQKVAVFKLISYIGSFEKKLILRVFFMINYIVLKEF